MAAFVLIGSYANGTVVDGPENAAEFNNIYNAFNSTSTDKEIHHRYSGAEPGIIVDQLGAGPIARFRQGGVDKCVIGNDGKITNDNVVKDKFTWFIPAPSVPNGEIQKTHIIPNGTGMTITKLSIVRHSGGHTGGSTRNFQLFRNGVNIGSVGFSDANNAVDTEYSTVLAVAVNANDRLTITTSGVGATSETDVTVMVEWQQKLG